MHQCIIYVHLLCNACVAHMHVIYLYAISTCGYLLCLYDYALYLPNMIKTRTCISIYYTYVLYTYIYEGDTYEFISCDFKVVAWIFVFVRIFFDFA